MKNLKDQITKRRVLNEQQIAVLRNIEIPDEGWIKFIRINKGLSLTEFAKHSKRNLVALRELEVRESKQQIHLSSLKEIAGILDCKLIYALVPNESVPDFKGLN